MNEIRFHKVTLNYTQSDGCREQLSIGIPAEAIDEFIFDPENIKWVEEDPENRSIVDEGLWDEEDLRKHDE